MQQEGDRWWRLASRYSHDDHKPRRTTLAVMAVECGLSYADVAAACVFLARDESAIFSGAVIDLAQAPVGVWGDRPKPKP